MGNFFLSSLISQDRPSACVNRSRSTDICEAAKPGKNLALPDKV